jgi:hypothetical protein
MTWFLPTLADIPQLTGKTRRHTNQAVPNASQGGKTRQAQITPDERKRMQAKAMKVRMEIRKAEQRREISRRAGKVSAAKLTPEQRIEKGKKAAAARMVGVTDRSEFGRKLALARWGKK